MRRIEKIYFLPLLLLLLLTRCKKPFEPVVLTRADNYLVVDGFINTRAGAVTNILLSRTKSLTDTVISIPEPGASVAVVSASGASYPLHETQVPGSYSSDVLSLDANAAYKVSIVTSNQRQYESDLVTAKTTPPIDSVNWLQDSKGVNLYVNTHDPANTARYYRWTYVQTWEYHSQLETIWGLANGMAYVRTPEQEVHVCYNTSSSTGILLGTSAALSQDVISQKVLANFLPGDSTLWYRASFLVNQYAITPQAYAYWQIIQKNSEQLGTLFDLQPSQLEGNIQAVNNAAEPVVGFMSATNAQEKRIFIDNSNLQDWQPGLGTYECSVVDVPQNPGNFLIVNYPDDSYAPWYYVSFGPLKLAKKICLDCTLSGGVTSKPVFW